MAPFCDNYGKYVVCTEYGPICNCYKGQVKQCGELDPFAVSLLEAIDTVPADVPGYVMANQYKEGWKDGLKQALRMYCDPKKGSIKSP